MATESMTSIKRLKTVLEGKEPDRTPMLGGWISAPQHIADIIGESIDTYWEDPVEASIRAYKKLGMDALLDISVPLNRYDFRIVDANTYAHAESSLSLEDTVEKIDNMPSAEKIVATFDFDVAYENFRDHMIKWQTMCGDMVYMPPQWDAGAKISWYQAFGYENFFLIIGMYPEIARKLMEVGGAQGYNQSRVIAQAVKDGIYPKAVLLGEDICTQRGPMISPDFVEKYYAPQLRNGLKPLLDVGCRPVWHCDGDVRLILDMLIDCGIQGMQGFQPECGIDIDYIVRKRTRENNKLLIFGPISVTTELPVCSPEEIKMKVRHAIEVCSGNADLMLFTANTINPDVPLENITAMYEAVKDTR